MNYDPSPTPGAHVAQPYQIHEIDQHPDADRIWSTIMQFLKVLSGHIRILIDGKKQRS